MQRVWVQLAVPGTAADIAARLGLAERTTRRYLARLASFGLALPYESGRRWRRGHSDPASLADQFALGALAEQQRIQHEREREEWAVGRAKVPSPHSVVTS
jgi:hypothetical protein